MELKISVIAVTPFSILSPTLSHLIALLTFFSPLLISLPSNLPMPFQSCFLIRFLILSAKLLILLLIGTSSNISFGVSPAAAVSVVESVESAVSCCMTFNSSNDAILPSAAFCAFLRALACFSAALAALLVELDVLFNDSA